GRTRAAAHAVPPDAIAAAAPTSVPEPHGPRAPPPLGGDQATVPTRVHLPARTRRRGPRTCHLALRQAARRGASKGPCGLPRSPRQRPHGGAVDRHERLGNPSEISRRFAPDRRRVFVARLWINNQG